MNRKARKLLFIRSKNKMIAKGYKPTKWKLENHSFPTQWTNTDHKIYEESFIIDMRIVDV